MPIVWVDQTDREMVTVEVLTILAIWMAIRQL